MKSGDTYVYAPTTLGSRSPLPYVNEPIASASASVAGPSQTLEPIVQALNAEASLKGSKLTVAPDGETITLTGVTITRDQMKRAMEIVTSQAGEGKVANAIQTEELVVVSEPQAPAPMAEASEPASEAAPATAAGPAADTPPATSATSSAASPT
jgi:hypothetical protein